MAVLTQAMPSFQTPPGRPRFLSEAVVIPFEDALLAYGTEQPQLLRGASIRGFLPDLIPLMDGSRGLAELQEALPGVSAAQVRAAVSLLFHSGLLEDGTDNGAADSLTNAETLAFFRRFSGATRWNRSGAEAYEKLQAAEIVIVQSAGSSQGGEILKSLLTKTGAAGVMLLNRDSLKASGLPGSGVSSKPPIIVSLSLSGEDPAWHLELDEWCYERQIPWLRAVVDSGANYADLGPCFKANESPCYRCFQAIHSRSGNLAGAPANAEFWISMLALEITYLLSRIAPAITGAGFRRYDLSRWDSKDLRNFRLPGCSRCRPLVEDPSNNVVFVDTALVFEDSVGLISRSLIDPKSDQERSRLGAALGRQAKQLSVCKQYALNPQITALDGCVLKDIDSGGTVQPRRLTVDDLATLLKLTAGLRVSPQGEDEVRRWAATGGNLGSVELYAAVRDVDGLPSGLYFYQPQEHSLAVLNWRTGGIEAEEFIRRVIPRDSLELPDALILFTGAFHRVARKYGPFGYRLINLDAGAAVSQLQVAANGLGIRSRTAVGWADDLIADQLKLEPLDEQSTAVVALYAATLPPARKAGKLRSGHPRSTKPVGDFRELSLAEVVQTLYRESRTEERELPLAGFAIPPELAHRNLDILPAISLPAPARAGQSAHQVLASRKTIRQYTGDPVALGQLGTMLFHAHGGDARDWPEEHDAGHTLRFLAVVRRVDQLSPGAYIYDSRSHCLRLSRPAPSPGETSELFIQDDFAAAPLSIWIIGNLAAACARHGAWGHRQLLLRAGAAAHRLWMAALTLRLAGSIVAGLVPGAARPHLGLDGYKQAGLVAFTAGFEAETMA